MPIPFITRDEARGVVMRTPWQKLRVGLDVDGVIFKWGHSVRRVCRERFGIEVPNDEWFGEAHVAPDQWAWLWSPEGVREIFGTGRSFPGSVRGARELCKRYDVTILTACPEPAHDARREWLHRRGIMAPVVFVPVPKRNDGKQSAGKSAVKPHCDVYIDDNSNNVDELVTNTRARRIIIVDHTWNRGADAPKSKSKRIVRAESWSAVLRLVKEVA